MTAGELKRIMAHKPLFNKLLAKELDSDFIIIDNNQIIISKYSETDYFIHKHNMERESDFDPYSTDIGDLEEAMG